MFAQEVAETASNGWGPGETIALVAVLVTGLGALAGLAVSYLQSRDRLAHERRESVKGTAADVYQKAGEVLRLLNENTVYPIAQDKDKRRLGKAVDAMDAARESSAVVAALGWSTEVRDGAQAVADELQKLGSRVYAAVGAIQSGTPTEVKAVAEVEAQTGRLQKVLEEFRLAITKD